MRPELIMSIGLPASGKTELREELIRRDKIDEIISADDVRFYQYKTQFDPSIESQVWSIVKSEMGDCLADGKKCLLDATNIGKKRRDDFHAIADRFDADKRAIVLNMDFDVAMVRNKRDSIVIDGKPIEQQVPENVMYQMRADWYKNGFGRTEESIRNTLKDEFDEITVIDRYADKKDCEQLGGTVIPDENACMVVDEDDLSLTKKYYRMR